MALTRSQKAQNRVLRSWILQKAVEKVPIDTAYETFCMEKWSNAMEYIEFEFWYYRFYGGDHDLDYDKEFASKNRTFTDLPTKLFAKVVQELHPGDQLSLREVSKPIRIAMNPIKFEGSLLSFVGYDNEACVGYHNRTNSWTPTDGGCIMSIDDEERFQFGKSFMIEAIKHLRLVLSDPALEVKKLSVNLRDVTDEKREVYVNYMRKALSTIPHKIHIETLRMHCSSFETVLNLKMFCKPETLKFIETRCETILPKEIHEIRDTLLPSAHFREIELTIENRYGNRNIDTDIPSLFGFPNWDWRDNGVYQVPGSDRKFKVFMKPFRFHFSLLEVQIPRHWYRRFHF